MARWKKTQGRVLESEIREGYDEDDVVYTPYVRYAYAVDGHEYTNSRLYRFRDPAKGHVIWSYSRERAERIVRPPGTSIEVYYDPEHPERSCLIDDTIMMRTLSLLVILATLVLVIWVALIAVLLALSVFFPNAFAG